MKKLKNWVVFRDTHTGEYYLSEQVTRCRKCVHHVYDSKIKNNAIKFAVKAIRSDMEYFTKKCNENIKNLRKQKCKSQP